jgi:type I site-specific restriction-modification system R (restriction) subunit
MDVATELEQRFPDPAEIAKESDKKAFAKLFGEYLRVENILQNYDEFASDSGTELNAVLPKMSPLNPQYLTKKQSVFQKIAAFVEKFKGVGGQI